MVAARKIVGRHEVPHPTEFGGVGLQVYDFSPVRTVLGVFRSISQPEGFDFSPVTKICPEKFSGGPSERAMGKGRRTVSPQVVDFPHLGAGFFARVAGLKRELRNVRMGR